MPSMRIFAILIMIIIVVFVSLFVVCLQCSGYINLQLAPLTHICFDTGVAD